MPMRKSPPELIETFDRIAPADPLVERRKMFGFPAAFVNGNMFCGLFEDDVMLRLPPEGRSELAAQGGSPFAPMPGRPMREYMVLPRGLAEPAMAQWLSRALAFGKTLPAKQPKPRKKKAG